MNTLAIIIFYTFLITLCVWVAVFFVFLKKHLLDKIIMPLVSLSAGVLMGGAFLHLMLEALEKISASSLFSIFLASFAGFFFIEKLIYWRHCHKEECSVHTFGYMNLIGDSIHNFIDGLIIASAFIVDFRLGLTTTLAIAMHEIPQEISDYGVLIYAGIKPKIALLINYLVSLTVVLGGIIGYFTFSSYLHNIVPYLLPFAAGGFTYIAASDLIPEIRKEANFNKTIKTFLIFISGLLIMYLIK